jgi:S-formylglutathione hydrolase
VVGAYRMKTYVTRELVPWVEAPSRARDDAGIFGHSMGGHGALTLALSLPGLYRASARFAPIVAPSEVPWGQKAFAGYLGEDRARWAEHDACALVRSASSHGTASSSSTRARATSSSSGSSSPSFARGRVRRAGQPLRLRAATRATTTATTSSRPSIDEHLRHHAKALGA